MVLSTFKFYSDFFIYKNGYYEDVNWEYIGSHEAVIVGWDDKGWIAQNSFGSFWGNKRFFKVKFNNNLDLQMLLLPMEDLFIFIYLYCLFF